MFDFDPRPLLLAAGLLYIAMPLAVLVLLYERHSRPRLLAWCLGGVAMGIAACLFALRGEVPDWVSYPLANLFVFASVVIKVPVLQRERGLPAAPGVAVVLWLLASGLYSATWAAGWSVEARFSTTAVIQIVGTALVAWQADRLARELDSLGARLISLAYGSYSAMLVLRTVRVVAGWSDGQALSPEFDFLAVLAAALLAALCGNLGYLGVALDHARRHDLAQREALEELRDQQRQLELSAQARDAVRGERHRSSQVLAHEVRQPLHNAAVSLQAASAALSGRADVADAQRAMAQAQAVIRRVSASLDNTVAAASLLTSGDRLALHDVDLGMLVDLCLADLPPDARRRVRVEHRAELRSARLELNLMRLALRNLLINATLYTPPDSPVQLILQDCDELLALVIEVTDLGPGLPDAVQARLSAPDTAPPQPLVAPGHGLGLHIVQRVALLHGGRLDWRANTPTGSVFRLTLPQANPD
jgi:signal transduction histidine kinase